MDSACTTPNIFFEDSGAVYYSVDLDIKLRSHKIVSDCVGLNSKTPQQIGNCFPFYINNLQTAYAIKNKLLPQDSKVYDSLYESLKYKVFEYYMSKGMYITDAMKYGADFLLYEHDPLVCHASSLVFIQEKCPTSMEIVRCQRLAANVKKEAIIIIKDGSGYKEYVIGRVYQI